MQFADPLPEPMLLVTTGGRILAANRAASQVLELKREQLTDKLVFDLVADPPEKIREFLSLAVGSRELTPGSFEFRRPGEPLRCQADGVRIFGACGSSDARVLIRCHRGQQMGTRFVALNEQIDALNREIARRQQVEADLRREQQLVRELSTPVLQIRRRILLLPMIGTFDEERARNLTEQLLRTIRTSRARVVVLDVTGIAAIERPVAAHLARTWQAARLLGAQVVLTGISRRMADTLVEIGFHLGEVSTFADVQSGIEEAERIVAELPHPRPVDQNRRTLAS